MVYLDERKECMDKDAFSFVWLKRKWKENLTFTIKISIFSFFPFAIFILFFYSLTFFSIKQSLSSDLQSLYLSSLQLCSIILLLNSFLSRYG